MALELKYQDIINKFDERYWPEGIDKFEEFYLLYLREKGNYVYYWPAQGDRIQLPQINHHPELKEYEIWMTGYRATGESSTASLLGKIKARNFAQACHIYYCQNFLKSQEEYNNPNYKQYIDTARWDYDGNSLSIWACSLYWSEEIARKTFG